MPFHKRPVPSASWRSWAPLAGNINFTVQRRTQEGIDKNKSLSHRIKYTTTDLKLFRIILGDLQDSRYVVASGDSEDHILSLWAILKEAISNNDGPKELADWNNFFEKYVVPLEPGLQTRASSMAVSERSQSPISSMRRTAHVSPAQSPDPTGHGFEAPTSEPPISQEWEDGPKLSLMQICAGGVMDTWTWQNPYKAMFVLAPLLHGLWYGWGGAAYCVLIVALSGMDNFAAAAPSRSHCREGVDRLAGLFQALGSNTGHVRLLVFVCAAANFILYTASFRQYTLAIVADVALPCAAVVSLLGCLVNPKLRPTVTQPHVVQELSTVSPIPPATPLMAQAPPVATSAHMATPLPEPDAVAPRNGSRGGVAKPNWESNADLPPPAGLLDIADRPLKLMNSNKWAFKKENGGAKYFSQPSPWCDKQAIMCTQRIDEPLYDEMIAMLNDNPDGTNKNSIEWKFDRLLKSKVKIRDNDDGTAVVHTSYISPVMFIAPRDIVSTIYRTELDREHKVHYGLVSKDTPAGEEPRMFFMGAKNNPDAVPPVKGKQRAACHAFGVLLTELRGPDGKPCGIDHKMTMSIDPCGSIPTSVVDLSNFEQLEKMLLLKKLLLERSK